MSKSVKAGHGASSSTDRAYKSGAAFSKRTTSHPGKGVGTQPGSPLAAKSSSQEHSERKVLSGYAKAASQAEQLGRPVHLIVTVEPDGTEPTMVVRPLKEDPLDQALADARGLGARLAADILKSADMVTAREFGKLIGASHETVNQKRRSGAILAVEGAKRGLKYPNWQVTQDGRLLAGLAEATRELGGDPWTVYRFLLQRHGDLGGKTALDALKEGRVDRVLAAARNISHGVFA